MRRWRAAVLVAIALLAPVGLSLTADAAERTPSRWAKWRASEPPKTIQRAGYAFAFSSKAGEYKSTVAVVRVEGPRGQSVVIEGAEVGSVVTAMAEVTVARIDAMRRTPDILFRTFTGGAHCCMAYSLIRPTETGFEVSELDTWDDSAAPELQDLDGDGVMELVGRDQRLQYAFTSYAESVPPARIFQVVGGKLLDVSGEPRFRRVFAKELQWLKSHCAAERGRGYCASYAATAARLGRALEAWPVLDKAIPPDAEGDSAPAPCRNRQDPCRKDFRTFREAVAWYLRQLGYLPGEGRT